MVYCPNVKSTDRRVLLNHPNALKMVLMEEVSGEYRASSSKHACGRQRRGGRALLRAVKDVRGASVGKSNSLQA